MVPLKRESFARNELCQYELHELSKPMPRPKAHLGVDSRRDGPTLIIMTFVIMGSVIVCHDLSGFVCLPVSAISRQMSEDFSETSFQNSSLFVETSFSRRVVLTLCVVVSAAVYLCLSRAVYIVKVSVWQVGWNSCDLMSNPELPIFTMS